jgi:nucleotide-binding universal stress UspA family protein
MSTVNEDRATARTERAHPLVPIHERQGMRRILVCLDQSRRSETCLPCVTFLAQSFGAAITLLHVMESAHEGRVGHAIDAVGWEIARQEASAYLERCEKQAAGDLGRPVESRLEEGHAAERTHAVARELKADLTVLAAHGGERDDPGGLGSTAQQILSRPQGSVLVTHPTVPSGEFHPRRILLPLDGSSRTESTLPMAVRIATASHAELVLVHVVPELVPSGVLRSTEDVELAGELSRRLEAQAKAYLGELRQSLARVVDSVTAIVARHVDQAQCLLEISQRERIDFVVLSAHGSTCNRERSFGSVTTYLLEHSTVPVLVLQDLIETDVAHTAERGPQLRSAAPTGGP